MHLMDMASVNCWSNGFNESHYTYGFNESHYTYGFSYTPVHMDLHEMKINAT